MTLERQIQINLVTHTMLKRSLNNITGAKMLKVIFFSETLIKSINKNNFRHFRLHTFAATLVFGLMLLQLTIDHLLNLSPTLI